MGLILVWATGCKDMSCSAHLKLFLLGKGGRATASCYAALLTLNLKCKVPVVVYLGDGMT
eukprot:4524604-Ditylum_brightwellii.AAC.1